MASQHYHCGSMESMEDVDLEEQSPPPAPSSAELIHATCRKPSSSATRRAPVATPVRALWMVVVMVGLLFAAHLLARRDLRTLALPAAESVCVFLVMSCAAACEQSGRRRESGGAVADVALWSFAMARTATMTFWVAAGGMPLPAAAALYLLSLLVVSACFAVLGA